MNAGSEQEIIWTNAMNSLRQNLEENNFCGIYNYDLDDEDDKDMIRYLSNSTKNPFIKLYTSLYPIFLCHTNFVRKKESVFLRFYNMGSADDLDKKMLEDILSSNGVYKFDSRRIDERSLRKNSDKISYNKKQIRKMISEREKENLNCYVITAYYKRTANALREFSKRGMIFIENDLPYDVIKEFAFASNDCGQDGNKIIVLEEDVRFMRGTSQYQLNNSAIGRLLVSRLLKNGGENFSVKSMKLKNCKNDSAKSKDEKIKEGTRYLNRAMKEKLKIGYKSFEYNTDDKIFAFTPEFKKNLKIINKNDILN